jgi:hypothetical protein
MRVSDINIEFTWWQIVLWQLALSFWPLTAAAAVAAIWAWRRRASRVARVTAIVAIVLWAGSGVMNLLLIGARAQDAAAYSASLRARQRTLGQETTIRGIHLPRGTVVTHGDDGAQGDVVAVDLPTAVEIRGVPVIGHVGLSEGALDGDVTLERDARVGAAMCSSREGARFESGRLVACLLAEPSRIRGIPCSGSLDMRAGIVCTLASNYRRFGFAWRAQTKITDFGNLVWFRTGALAPSLRAFGSPLAPDSEVEFEHGRISSVDLRSRPARFRDCTIELLLVQGRSVTGQTSGSCDLQRVGPGNVALPSTTLSAPAAEPR